MSQDPANYWEEEYWEEIGRNEEIAAAIKNLSEEPIREFLGTYGDAIDARLDNTLAMLSDSWAKIFAKHIIQGRMAQAQERQLLPSVLSMYDIKIEDLKLSDGCALWKTFVTKIVLKRNAIMHEGDDATPAEAQLALECANTLRRVVVAQIGKKMGFDLEKNGAWHKHIDIEGLYYDPASPFK